MTPGEFRLRVSFRKAGRLRWLSHLEVVRALERSVRRAGLEYAVTHGFSPHMKIAFGPALPVGTAGEREYADVWLKRYTVASDALAALGDSAPLGLAPFEACYVFEKAPSLTAALTIASYRVEVDGEELDRTAVHAALEQVLSHGELKVTHKGKIKVFDLARSVPKDARVQDSEQGVVIELPIRMGPHGSLRPEAIVRAALEETGIEASAVRTTRLDLLVEDDDGIWSRPM
jgi:radical SAM-linked protein